MEQPNSTTERHVQIKRSDFRALPKRLRKKENGVKKVLCNAGKGIEAFLPVKFV